MNDREEAREAPVGGVESRGRGGAGVRSQPEPEYCQELLGPEATKVFSSYFA